MADEHMLGSVPDGWEMTTLGEIVERGGGSIQTGPFGSQLHASDYVPIGIPSIMPVNIGENRIIEAGIARITEQDADRLSRHRVEAGDIIYSRRGDVERRALVRGEQSGWLCGTGCLKVRLGHGVTDPLFASHYLGHPKVRAWIVQHAVGATMPNLNTGIMQAVPFLLPPLREQQAIASILGALDDKIELNRRRNRTLEAMARAIFQSWFVDFNPVKAKAAGQHPPGLTPPLAALFPDTFEDSNLGPIPKGWQVGGILDIADLLSGGTPKTSEAAYWGGAIPWASAKDVSQCGEMFLVDTERSITQAGLDNSSTQMIPALSSVVVARGATTGRMTMFASDIAMNQTCYALHSKSDTPRLLYLLLRSEIGKLVHAAHGSIFDTITTATFRASQIKLPGAAVAAEFEKLVTPLFDQVLKSLEQTGSLTSLRDTLLPKLISGELRVPDAERIVGRAV